MWCEGLGQAPSPQHQGGSRVKGFWMELGIGEEATKLLKSKTETKEAWGEWETTGGREMEDQLTEGKGTPRGDPLRWRR